MLHLKPHNRTRQGMIRLDGGRFMMGSDRFYPEEYPPRAAEVGPFEIDIYPVTNAEFAKFVAETGYVTVAEIAPDPAEIPGLLPEMAKPGSAVFRKPAGRVSVHETGAWWEFSFGANWKHPLGPDSTIDDLPDHPVVHIAYADAVAFAAWAGKALPTEAEWEFAARGGLSGADYAWGDELAPGGMMMANYWQGQFPFENLELDGYERTSPVGAFPPNGFGLHDMIGNVWEWTVDWYSATRTRSKEGSCCGKSSGQLSSEEESYDPALPSLRIPRKVIKGGSHLCAENYCRRYRPAARHPQSVDTSTSHIGFRCIRRLG